MKTSRIMRWWALALLLALPPALAAQESQPPGQAKRESKLYIVQMADAPVVAYSGGVAGLRATRPNRGQKIDPTSPEVVRYADFLTAKHDDALRRVGGARKAYSYKFSFNGFAAELSPAQVDALRALPGVLSVQKDEARTVDTSSTPAFLGLSGAGGVWAQAGATGENVIIGIVDSGFWPESLSFSDRTGTNGNATKDGKLSYQQIPGWHGRCVPGDAFNASHCNQKVIGAQYFNAGWGGNDGVRAALPWEFVSPRDYGGHGTHTASTAGGNANVPTTGDVAVFGPVSGIAPRARIAVYKVCWETLDPDVGGCYSSDSVAAIDQAVADGVDVINFSISGSRTNFRDSVEIAFLFAADAGVFVAASAGNSGPTTATVAHPGPWLTTVAAGTHNRNGEGSVTLGNGATYAGASFANALGSTPIVDSANAVAAGATALNAELCAPGALDSAAVAGKVVLCKRGVYALVDKSRAVFEAGGVGAVIYNDPAGATNTAALMHAVPTVHVVAASGLAIKGYIASAAPSASAAIAKSTIVYNAPAPTTATFSSRGPLVAGSGDLLKPDLMAPGQDILAAVAPPNNSGKDFDLYSGTSMSSPHVAGLAALFKQKYPGWSPMAIKSALMTTGYDVLDGPNTNPLVIFRQGAGHVQPGKALNPGLVYDAGFSDWLSFICAVQPGGGCTGVTPIDPSNLNVASIAIGDMAGTQTVTRRLTNVSGGKLTVTPSIAGLAGIDAVVSPASLTLARGETKSFTVTFTRTTAALNAYTGGQLTWTGGGFSVRSPIVIRPVALAAPAQVSGNYNVTFGFTGPFTASARGLVPAATFGGTISTGQQLVYQVGIPAGTTYARFSLFDADTTPGSDLDLLVYGPTNALVGSSGSATSAEEVNLLNPAAGTYTVVVDGYATASPSSTFTLFAWTLDATAAGNMTVTAPATATMGGSGAINLGFSGLTPGIRYLGSVAYSGAAGMPNPTIVRVDP